MKIKCEFGKWDGWEYISWYRDIADFPKLVRHMGDLYEFAMYQKESPGHQVDYTFFFSKTSKSVAKYDEIPVFKEMFAHCFIRSDECHCGAKYDKDNPKYHMIFCPKSKNRLTPTVPMLF